MSRIDPAFIEQLVNSANSNNELMDGTTEPVLKILNDADVVFGIWQDPQAEYGVDYMVVKGAYLLGEIAISKHAKACRISAINCIEFEQAEALRLVHGVSRTEGRGAPRLGRWPVRITQAVQHRWG